MTEHDIFAVAVELTGDRRSSFLLAACGDDQELRSRVEALLKAHNDSACRRPKPSDPGLDVTRPFANSISVGMLIDGKYRLLEAVGEGGMGTVWMAEQIEPIRRKVAVKLVKAGMDSAQVLARFESERQALALMDHNNIAKVFDGGMTQQGRPYFVMEFVKGVPFTEYCDLHRLSLNERLSLFIPVCQAVQHAHQKGIIHRDLKPSNILVCLHDGKPVPKVIDFGLAKALHFSLTEQTLHTAIGMMVGTPLYMSPEQAEYRNLDVDTRTDIYSLGVILYELLTGSTPLERQQLQAAAYEEILRLIKEIEPPKPSTRLSGSVRLPAVAAQRNIEPKQLRKSLTGDLDWIVMKSLDKDRSRRYETANGLARDVERYLNDEAVEASPPSSGYRLRKMFRKHRSAIGTAAAFAALLVGSTGISVWQAVRATKAERAANHSASNAIASEARAVAALRQVTQERDAKNAALAAESAQRDLTERQFVEGMLRPIGYGERPNPGEIQGFVEWASLPDSRLRLRVLEVAFEQPESAYRLARRSDRTVQSAVGISPSRRTKVLELLSIKQRQSQATPQLRTAACWLAIELGSTDLPALTESIAWLGGPKTTASIVDDDFRNFIATMTRQRDALSPENGLCGGEALIDLLKSSPDAQQRDITGKALAALVPRFSQERVSLAWDALVALLEKPAGVYPLPAVEYSLAALAPRLSPERLARATDTLVGLAENSTNPFVQVVAGKSLAALAPQLGPEQASFCWDALLPSLKNSTDARVRLTANDALRALVPRLSPDRGKHAVDALIAILENSADYDAKPVADTLGQFAPQMSEGQMARAWKSLATLLETSTAYDVQHAAGEELVELAPYLSPGEVIDGWNSLLALLDKSTNINTRNAATRGLIALARSMKAEQATRGMESLIPLLEKSTDREILGSGARAALGMAPQLPPESAAQVWDTLVRLLGKATDLDFAEITGLALRDLAPQLSPDQASRGGESLLALLEQATFNPARSAASNGLAGLAPQLSPEQVTRTANSLIAVVENGADHDVKFAVKVLAEFAPRLGEQQVARAWEALTAVLEKSSDELVLHDTGDGLAALAPQLTSDKLIRSWQSLNSRFKAGNRKYSLRALQALAPRLNPEQRLAMAETFLEGLSQSFHGELAVSLSAIVPLLAPSSRDRFSAATLTILLDQEATFHNPYQVHAYTPDGLDAASRALSNPKLMASLFAHPGCRGEPRETMLQRFEELVLHEGRPVFLNPMVWKDAERPPRDTPANTRPMRRFRNLHDVANWIQKEWPDFDLETWHPAIGEK